MKIVVAGSRSLSNYDLNRIHISRFFDKLNEEDIEIVSGTCRGPDLHGERFAKERNFSIKRFPPNWALGKGAGFKRNSEMADYADAALILWDGKSNGSKHMANEMKKINKPYLIMTLNYFGMDIENE